MSWRWAEAVSTGTAAGFAGGRLALAGALLHHDQAVAPATPTRMSGISVLYFIEDPPRESLTESATRMSPDALSRKPVSGSSRARTARYDSPGRIPARIPDR